MNILKIITRQLSLNANAKNSSTTTSLTSSGSRKQSSATDNKGNRAPKLKQYTLKEVAAHSDIDSCWMVVNDKVYDLTEFIEYHPGGYEIMIEYAGADATNAFNVKPHTLEAAKMLEKYLIGELVQEDRM